MLGKLYYYIDGNYMHHSSISRDEFAQDVRVGDYIEVEGEATPLLVTKIVHHPTSWGGNCDVHLQHVDMDKEKEIEKANCKILYI